jgi:hypothetical protein
MRSPMRLIRHAVTLVFLGACSTQAPDEPVTRSGSEGARDSGGAAEGPPRVEPERDAAPTLCTHFPTLDPDQLEGARSEHYDTGALSDYLDADPGEDCDCSAERPCPMRCGGAYPSEGDYVEPDSQTFAFCSDPIDRDRPCPLSTAADPCGAISISHTPIGGRYLATSVIRWYDPNTYEQTGWEAYFANAMTESSIRYCGGVVPDRACTLVPRTSILCWSDAGGLNRVDPNAETCECPPPSACED